MARISVSHPTPEPGADSGDRPGLAIVLLLMAMAAFVTMDGLAKSLVGQGLAPELIVLWRYALVTVVLLPFIARYWGRRAFRTGPARAAHPARWCVARPRRCCPLCHPGAGA